MNDSFYLLALEKLLEGVKADAGHADAHVYMYFSSKAPPPGLSCRQFNKRCRMGAWPEARKVGRCWTLPRGAYESWRERQPAPSTPVESNDADDIVAAFRRMRPRRSA